MTPEEFRALGHQVIDFIADYRATNASLPVMSQVQPGEIRASISPSPPESPEPFDSILSDVKTKILPGLSHWQHPDFFAYFPSNGELAAVLGDLLSTGLGVLGLSWQSSPALTELEEVTTDWMRQMLGLSEAWSGVIQDTASTASLLALLSARERASNYSFDRGGLQGQEKPLIVYISSQSHSSIDKAAILAGFGRSNIRVIPANKDKGLTFDPEALSVAIQTDIEAGKVPCAIVVTIGTTASTAIEPLEELIVASRAFPGLWVHVDAAMAGSAMILPECRWMWRGIEGADSIVVNAHKWLGVSFDCSLYYVRTPIELIRLMSTNPSYLKSALDGQVKNYRDWGIPLGRRFRALKLWCVIREQGVSGLQRRLRRDVENARWLKERVESTEGWRLVAPLALQTLCVRHEPRGLEDEALLDAHTQRWVDRVNRSGAAYLTPAVLDGRWMCRISIGSLTTERENVQKLWDTIQKEAEAALAEGGSN